MPLNIPKGYVPNRPMREIEKDFKKGGYGTIDNFIAKNFTVDTGGSGIAGIPTTQSAAAQLKSISFQYLNDTGSGRISQGVSSLEGITKALKGVPIHSLTLFDQFIFTDPSVFNTNDKTTLRAAVYDNLGMTQFIPAAQIISTSAVNNLNTVVDAIIKSMKNFTFTFDNYIDTALGVCKVVVEAALKYNG